MTMMINPFRFSNGYLINQSIRFNDDDSAYMSRTPTSSGNRKTWTFSCWVKRSNLGMWQTLLSARTDDNNRFQIRLNASDQISITSVIAASTTINIVTNAVFRDPSAWYHILVNVDTAQATSSDRVSLWVNGTKATSFLTSTYPTLNEDTQINNTIQHAIGRLELAIPTQYYDGYFSEINLVDGTTYPSSSFGEADTNGNWIPKKFTGVYGTNGFYIDGANAASLGTDVSGNGNNFTTSGLTTADQMLDSPTDDAANGVGNYCVLSNLVGLQTVVSTWSDGNLSIVGNDQGVFGTIGVSSGKWYFEMTSGDGCVGVINENALGDLYDNTVADGFTFGGVQSDAYGYYNSNGNLFDNGTTTGYGATYATTDVIGVALDLDNGFLYFAKANTWQNSGVPTSGATGTGAAAGSLTGTWFPLTWATGTVKKTMNFGQSGFTYTPPTGFKALNTANLPAPAIPDPSAYFQAKTYVGNGTAIGSGGNGITFDGNSNLSPDLVWIKNRNTISGHILTDTIRGATKDVRSHIAAIETTDVEKINLLNSNGFTVGSNANVNENLSNHVAWNWKKGAVPGFDIVADISVTSSKTINHSLGTVPDFIVAFDRSVANQHPVWHSAIHATSGNGNRLYLDDNSTDALGAFSFAAATPTNITVGSHTAWASSFVFYLFTEKTGFSKFGSYTGNGSTDGPFIYCGFRPAFVMQKYTGIEDWNMHDNTRPGYNPIGGTLSPNAASAESIVAPHDDAIDLLSNGFKIKSINSRWNISGGNYIYMAFAEYPFGGAGVSQARAR